MGYGETLNAVGEYALLIYAALLFVLALGLSIYDAWRNERD